MSSYTHHQHGLPAAVLWTKYCLPRGRGEVQNSYLTASISAARAPYFSL